MDWQQVARLIEQAQQQGWSWSQFLAQVATAGVASLGEDAQLDLDRPVRCGWPEVVFAQGKTVQQVCEIFSRLVNQHGTALATRVSPQQAQELHKRFPQGEYHAPGRTFRLGRCEVRCGPIVVVAAGTADLPVAYEALQTALWMGASAQLIADVGVAGPQRIVAHLPQLLQAQAVVVAAGMEGALPSVVGGLVRVPVVAVPTSVGYGVHLAGWAPLLTMLNSCAPNVCVVNIDAGFKAGYLAAMIARQTPSCNSPSSAASKENTQ